MRHTRIIVAVLAALALATTSATAASRNPNTDRSYAGTLDTSSAIVVLDEQPLSTYDGHVPGYARTNPSAGKLNPKSAAYQKYLSYLKGEHAAYGKWLAANVPGAKITSDLFVSLNAVAVKLNGNSISRLKNSHVKAYEYNALYHPTMSESYKIIHASGAWSDAGGRADAGAGIKIGDIDSGIDQTHPFFDPTGFSYPSGFPKCDATDSSTHTPDSNCKYVNRKVIVAKVFYNKADVSGLDAKAVDDHGTHTAGIAAGVTGKNAKVNGVSIDDMSGVAPGAWLGNYNVFPGTIASARSEDILNAIDAAVVDGMDVLNLSLGGGYRGNTDLLAAGLDNAVDAGVVVAVAAGNSGPGSFTLESPGRARNVITVGASTNQHFVGQAVGYPSLAGTVVGAAIGDFPALPAGSHNLVISSDGAGGLNDACSSLPAAGGSNKVVLVTRGACTFSTKVRSAIAAGYAGVLVRNNVAGDPTAMAKDGLGGDDLPAVMVSKSHGDAIQGAAPATIAAASGRQEFVPTGNEDILAGFSSQGPTFVDLAIKPDLVSVGVNVVSSIPVGPGDDWAFFNGTSMSTPHIAGSAAVILSIHPNWSPARVKSALVNRASRVIDNAFDGGVGVGPMAQGNGRENLTNAAEGTTWLSPVSASFGKVPVNQATAFNIRVHNPTGSSQTFALSELKFTPSGTISSVWNAGTTSSGDSRITSPASVTVAAHGATWLTIWVNAGLAPGTVVQGWIKLDGPGSNNLRFAYWAQVGP